MLVLTFLLMLMFLCYVDADAFCGVDVDVSC